jgi:hypothetical protein
MGASEIGPRHALPSDPFLDWCSVPRSEVLVPELHRKAGGQLPLATLTALPSAQHLAQLRSGDKILVVNKGYRRYLKVEREGHFQIDKEQINAEAWLRWALGSAHEYPARGRNRGPRIQEPWDGGDLFRTAKSNLETRPFDQKCDETHSGATSFEVSKL